MKQRDYLVYLSGPISGLTFDGCQDWRDYVAQNLPEEIHAMSPLRGKEMLRKYGVIEGCYEEHPMSTQAAITCRDRNDCFRADALLVNLLDTNRISVGTCIELGWADARRVPIVLVMERTGNTHDHPIVRAVSGYRVETLDDGIRMIEALLMPGGVGTAREIIPGLRAA